MEYQYPLDLDWTNEEMMKVIHFLIKLKIIMNPLSKVKRSSMLINNLKKLCQVKLKKNKSLKNLKIKVDTIVIKLFKRLINILNSKYLVKKFEIHPY